jgi:acyl-CoA synthetase (AMP-forming)/AMP-acid ligase II
MQHSETTQPPTPEPKSADLQPAKPSSLNIADRLSESAKRYPFRQAVIFPTGRDKSGRAAYTHLTFQQLDRESDRLARGLIEMGVWPGTRMVLMVRPSLEFITLTFALFKAGAVIVLIDPGMGPANIFRCLEEVDPDGFVAISRVHAGRLFKKKRFPHARLNVTVGRRWFWGGPTYRQLLGDRWTPFDAPLINATDPAAIIFTSGSTGPPKGVLYEHGMFDAQVDLLQEFYTIEPGESDLPGFPLFALFNSAMGVTTVIPDMDPTKPAQVNPANIVEAIEDFGITQAFGSPAIWNRVGRYCSENGIEFPTIKRVLSAGAPVPHHVLERMSQAITGEHADVHTPYGATESLPVCSISGREVLEETAQASRGGAGTCVGTVFPQMNVRIIDITGDAIENYSDARELPTGKIGEIIVSGPVVTREYFNRPEATRLAKIPDGERFWHRMGDVGYFDDKGRLWFCGRKAHIVDATAGRMFSVRCEAIFNNHPQVFRSALVGVGDKPSQRPVIILEPEEGQYPESDVERKRFESELLELAKGNSLTATIDTILFHRSLPVDVRHNVKIFREKLAPWAAEQLKHTA